jgi:hypothetical protein
VSDPTTCAADAGTSASPREGYTTSPSAGAMLAATTEWSAIVGPEFIAAITIAA